VLLAHTLNAWTAVALPASRAETLRRRRLVRLDTRGGVRAVAEGGVGQWAQPLGSWHAFVASPQPCCDALLDCMRSPASSRAPNASLGSALVTPPSSMRESPSSGLAARARSEASTVALGFSSPCSGSRSGAQEDLAQNLRTTPQTGSRDARTAQPARETPGGASRTARHELARCLGPFFESPMSASSFQRCQSQEEIIQLSSKRGTPAASPSNTPPRVSSTCELGTVGPPRQRSSSSGVRRALDADPSAALGIIAPASAPEKLKKVLAIEPGRMLPDVPSFGSSLPPRWHSSNVQQVEDATSTYVDASLSSAPPSPVPCVEQVLSPAFTPPMSTKALSNVMSTPSSEPFGSQGSTASLLLEGMSPPLCDKSRKGSMDILRFFKMKTSA